MNEAVAYCRMSSARGRALSSAPISRPGEVDAICATEQWQLIAPPFAESRNAKREERPQLIRAIDLATRAGAKLVIFDWDRITRDVEALVALQSSGVDFIAADDPSANRSTIRLLVGLAQKERAALSHRVKEALAVAKTRGCRANGKPWKHGAVRLGNPMGAAAFGNARGAAIGAAAKKRDADDRARTLAHEIDALREKGITSLRQIADALNAAGVGTPRAGKWHSSSVRNVLRRLGY